MVSSACELTHRTDKEYSKVMHSFTYTPFSQLDSGQTMCAQEMKKGLIRYY